MKTLLTLAAALTLGATIAGHPGQGATDAPSMHATIAQSDGAGPELIRGAVRRAVGLDRLQPLLARAR